MRSEVVQASDRIPELEARAGIALQQHLPAGPRVLLIGADAAVRRRRSRIVSALSLAHRIEPQNQIAEPDKALAAALVEIARLAVGGVAHLKEYTRVGRTSRSRDVEVRADQKVRLALVDDLFKAVALALERPDGARI